MVPWIEMSMDLVSRRTKDPPGSSRAYAYVSVAMSDAAVAAAHWQERFGDPGYPSLRAAVAGAAAGVLPEMVLAVVPAGLVWGLDGRLQRNRPRVRWPS